MISEALGAIRTFGPASWRWVKRRFVKFGPMVSTTEPQCREERPVVIKYGTERRETRAVYLRLWLYSCRDQKCTVEVRRVTYQRSEVESVRSPLDWTDIGGHEPQRVGHKIDDGRYVDLGLAVDDHWRPCTLRAASRSTRFTEHGVYTVDYVIENVEMNKRWKQSVAVVFRGDCDSLDFHEGRTPRTDAMPSLSRSD
jgi:hypothetical protein